WCRARCSADANAGRLSGSTGAAAQTNRVDRSGRGLSGRLGLRVLEQHQRDPQSLVDGARIQG
ncbi:unnamed protein product, partial [Adineta steineri]